ncbi:MAG: hypothetical protein J6X59_05230 [Bacteroidales bacterium]|jgi:hypothetical protein|nr:hypothetical protein [Bacteroidales bacterium]
MKVKKPKQKKYVLTLSEREALRLGRYADAVGVSRPLALQRLVKQALRQAADVPAGKVDSNQLGLFDTLQIDIFNNTTVVNEKES